VAEWHWELVTDDLLDGLPPAALASVRQVAEELSVRESMIFLDGREFTGKPPGLRTVQRGPLMLVYLTDVRSERVVIIQVNWISYSKQPQKLLVSAAGPSHEVDDPPCRRRSPSRSPGPASPPGSGSTRCGPPRQGR
jgi:hypothetical protein